MTILSPAVIAAAHAHALADHPREACGLVVDGAYVPVANVAADPERDFRMRASDCADALMRATAVLHSHPDGTASPSENDMRGQIQTRLPWGVFACNGESCSEIRLWGDGVEPAPLIGRDFVWGIWDCFGLARDYYRLEHGIVLADVPRSYDWWHKGQNLYLDHLAGAGFRRIDPARDGLRPGDGFLARVRSPVPNHAGVYVGDETILHHLEGRLSRREPVHPWMELITHWVRHEALFEDGVPHG